MNPMSENIILASIIARFIAGLGAYFVVIQPLLKERQKLSTERKRDNAMLIASVGTFMGTCFGTALFQACRIGFVPNCSADIALDIVTTLNSITLLSAFAVMYLIVHPRKEGRG